MMRDPFEFVQGYRQDTALESAQRQITQKDEVIHRQRKKIIVLTFVAYFLFACLIGLSLKICQLLSEHQPTNQIISYTIHPSEASATGAPCHGLGHIQYVNQPSFSSSATRLRFLSWLQYDCAEEALDSGRTCHALCWPKNTQTVSLPTPN